MWFRRACRRRQGPTPNPERLTATIAADLLGRPYGRRLPLLWRGGDGATKRLPGGLSFDPMGVARRRSRVVTGRSLIAAAGALALVVAISGSAAAAGWGPAVDLSVPHQSRWSFPVIDRQGTVRLAVDRSNGLRVVVLLPGRARPGGVWCGGSGRARRCGSQAIRRARPLSDRLAPGHMATAGRARAGVPAARCLCPFRP
jgi:hypothetical protein